MFLMRTSSLLRVLSVSLLFIGCQRSVDPAVLHEREKYLLSEEPKGAQGVLATRVRSRNRRRALGHRS